MSIEGDRDITDARRGAGVYDRLVANMDELSNRGLIFGASRDGICFLPRR